MINSSLDGSYYYAKNKYYFGRSKNIQDETLNQVGLFKDNSKLIDDLLEIINNKPKY